MAEKPRFRRRTVFAKKLGFGVGFGYRNNTSVPQLVEQLINTTLSPAFFGKFVCQPLRCVPLQLQTFHQNLVLIA